MGARSHRRGGALAAGPGAGADSGGDARLLEAVTGRGGADRAAGRRPHALGGCSDTRFATVAREVVVRDIVEPLAAIGITLTREEREELL